VESRKLLLMWCGSALVLVSASIVAPRVSAAVQPETPIPTSVVVGTSTSTTTITVPVPSSQPTTLPPTSAGVSFTVPLFTTIDPVQVGSSTSDVSTIPTDPNGSTTIPLDDGGSTTTTIDPLASSTTTIDPLTSSTIPISEWPLNGYNNGLPNPVETDAESEEIPVELLTLNVPYGAPYVGTNFQEQLAKLTAQQRTQVAAAQSALQKATAAVESARRDLDEISSRRVTSEEELRIYNQLRLELTWKMRNRAVRQYTGESVRFLGSLLDAKDINSFRRRSAIITQAQRRDAALVASYRRSEQDAEQKQLEIDNLTAARQFKVDQLVAEETTVKAEFERVNAILGAISAPDAVSGFVFPVQPPYSFVDTYQADRMNGTQYQHKHQGVDIFAVNGQPIVASKRGIVYKVGQARLGGNRLWLKDEQGNCYYYAHLTAFAEGIYDNKIVSAGEVLGFVGTTGNAVGTPPHLHYEIHPGCSGPVNPNPLLRAVQNNSLEQYIIATRPVFGDGLVGGAPVTTPVGPLGSTVPGSPVPTTRSAPLVSRLGNGSTVVIPTSRVVRKVSPSTDARPVPQGVNPTMPTVQVTAPPETRPGAVTGAVTKPTKPAPILTTPKVTTARVTTPPKQN
jgi:murein DD-endopeptidase MepM/ murein hydrolase activator NlpD